MERENNQGQPFHLSKEKKFYKLELGGESHQLLPISVEKFGLFSLDCLEDSLLSKLLDYDSYIRAKEQAYRYLSLRDHFEKELENKLRQKGYSHAICSRVIPSLYEEGLLDDYRITLAFAKEKLQKEGRQKVFFRLIQKGVEPQVANGAIKACDIDEYRVCLDVLKEKLESLNLEAINNQKEEIKLVNFLKNRGFCTQNILKAIKNLKKIGFLLIIVVLPFVKLPIFML